MRIVLVSPAWQRFDVTRLVLAERRWLCDVLATRGHEATSVIVADDENLEIAREYGFHTVERDNSDVGLRFNAGYQAAAELGADIFVHIGSDDWVHPDAFAILDEVDLTREPEPDFTSGEAQVWRRAPMVVAQRRATIVDVPSGRLQRCKATGSRGCIPWLIPRVVMRAVRFTPLPRGLMRGIDGSLARGLRSRPNWVFQEAQDDWLVDFKTAVNLTNYEGLAFNIGYGDPLPIDVLADSYPDALVQMASDLAASEEAVA